MKNMVWKSAAVALIFLVGLFLMGCANQRDLVRESFERRSGDREITSKVLDVENAGENRASFFAKELDRLEAKIEHLEYVVSPADPYGPGRQDEFDRASEEAVGQTDAKFCLEGKKQNNEFWVKVFCKRREESLRGTK